MAILIPARSACQAFTLCFPLSMYTHSKCSSPILESCLSRALAQSHNIFHSLNKIASRCPKCLSFFPTLDHFQRSFHSTIVISLQPKQACRQSPKPLTLLYLEFLATIALDNKLTCPWESTSSPSSMAIQAICPACLLEKLSSLPCLWLLVGTIQLHRVSWLIAPVCTDSDTASAIAACAFASLLQRAKF